MASPRLVPDYGCGLRGIRQVAQRPLQSTEPGPWYSQTMILTVELDRETDGRWLADVVDLPGVLTYGETRDQALAAAQALALRVLADRIEHGEAGRKTGLRPEDL